MTGLLRGVWGAPPELPGRAAPGEVLVVACGATVELGGRLVVGPVDVAVRSGELVALVGPNGAGKSTLLGALAGDVALRGGSIRAWGEPLARWSDGELGRRRAVLPQDATVRFPFTVEQVVRMGRAPWAGTPAEDLDDVAVLAAMADADVEHLAGRTAPSLSGGERARTALARILAQDAQLLLLDEPTAALDIHHQELTLEVVRARVDAGAGAVVVLHDLALAGAHADRVVLLSSGAVAAEGPPSDVLRADVLSAVYGHAIEVLPHPRTGAPLVLPRRHPRHPRRGATTPPPSEP